MITIDLVKSIYRNNYLIPEDGQCFYGYLDLDKSDLNKLNLEIKNKKEKFIISLGASREDLIVIPYSKLNEEFSLDRKMIYSLNNITGIKIKKFLNNYALSIYLNKQLFLTIKFLKRHFQNQEFYNNVVNFSNRFKTEGIDLIVKTPKKDIVIEEHNIEKSTNQNFISSPLKSTYNFASFIIPTILLENPESSQNNFLAGYQAVVKGNEQELVISNKEKNIVIPSKRISEIIVRKSIDGQNIELWVRSHNETLAKIIITEASWQDKEIKNNIKSFINGYIHNGEDLDNIILNKKEDKKKSLFNNLFWFIILLGIFLGIYLFLK